MDGEIIADFKVWCFHQFYRRVFREELDSVLRFAKALAASSQPIPFSLYPVIRNFDKELGRVLGYDGEGKQDEDPERPQNPEREKVFNELIRQVHRIQASNER